MNGHVVRVLVGQHVLQRVFTSRNVCHFHILTVDDVEAGVVIVAGDDKCWQATNLTAQVAIDAFRTDLDGASFLQREHRNVVSVRHGNLIAQFHACFFQFQQDIVIHVFDYFALVESQQAVHFVPDSPILVIDSKRVSRRAYDFLLNAIFLWVRHWRVAWHKGETMDI